MNTIFIILSVLFTFITIGGLVFIMYNLHRINKNIDKIETNVQRIEVKSDKIK